MIQPELQVTSASVAHVELDSQTCWAGKLGHKEFISVSVMY